MTSEIFPLAIAAPEDCGMRSDQFDRLSALIESHIAEGKHPGAQIAIARHGKLVYEQTFGYAGIGERARPASSDTLWLLYSNTKVITAAALWILAERGKFSFADRIADYLPEFAKNGKGNITILQLLTHQGGFPNAVIDRAAWNDHALMRAQIAEFSLEWTPGSRYEYHATAAHWVAAMVINAISGTDYRTFIHDEIIQPLGLEKELFVGLPKAEMARAADMHVVDTGHLATDPISTADDFRMAGIPGGGGYGTARAMAAFYQALIHGGALGERRILSPRMIAFATKDWTPGKHDVDGSAVHFGLGPYLRGDIEIANGLGGLGSPRTFGHGGAGSSVCWGDPDSGVSFAYVSNARQIEPWNMWRRDLVSNIVHAATL
jgi:CubicO group peptidase (beta-lactamase class C family)